VIIVRIQVSSTPWSSILSWLYVPRLRVDIVLLVLNVFSKVFGHEQICDELASILTSKIWKEETRENVEAQLVVRRKIDNLLAASSTTVSSAPLDDPA
jgi:hypothetical protein